MGIQITVEYFDHQFRHYSVDPQGGWRIDSASRCIVIGRFPRRYIPLDRVHNFYVENTEER